MDYQHSLDTDRAADNAPRFGIEWLDGFASHRSFQGIMAPISSRNSSLWYFSKPFPEKESWHMGVNLNLWCRLLWTNSWIDQRCLIIALLFLPVRCSWLALITITKRRNLLYSWESKNSRMKQALFILILALASCIPAVRLIRDCKRRRCPLCGGQLALSRISDPTGENLSKKITLSLYQGPKNVSEQWVCKKCNHKQKVKYWSN